MDRQCHQFRVPSSICLHLNVSHHHTSHYIASCLVGCWLSDPLNHFLGRRGTPFFCSIFCIRAVLGQAFTQTWQQLLVITLLHHHPPLILTSQKKICRLLLGLGMGPKASTSPIFSAENVPAKIRGGLIMCWQLWASLSYLSPLDTHTQIALTRPHSALC